MALQLPTAPVAPTRISPKILILYSLPKVGKTDALAHLPGCLILDGEGGAEGYPCMRIAIYSSQDIKDVRKLIEEEGARRYTAGKRGDDLFPYQFIAIDTADKMEEFAEISATAKYRVSLKNKNKKFEENGYTSVNEMAEGYGYQYTRNEFLELLNDIASVCPRIIVTAHVKDKRITEKSGDIVTVSDLSLVGKLSQMTCARADAIGYMYRSQAKDNYGELMVSFATNESAVMGARQKYLAGKKLPFDWATIYPDVFEEGTENLKLLRAAQGLAKQQREEAEKV